MSKNELFREFHNRNINKIIRLSEKKENVKILLLSFDLKIFNLILYIPIEHLYITISIMVELYSQKRKNYTNKHRKKYYHWDLLNLAGWKLI